jgi:hypothetical protein
MGGRQVPDERMLWKWTDLMRFAHFPTINTVLSNAPELRIQSRHVIRFRMEKRPTMTRCDGASELQHSNEGCKPKHFDAPWT